MKKIILLLFIIVNANAQNPTFQSVQQYESTQGINCLKIITDNSGNTYSIGLFSGTVDFDLSANIYNVTSSVSGNDAYILKLDSAGLFVFVKTFEATTSTSILNISEITLDSNNNFYITGNFMGTIDFDPNAATFNMTAPADQFNGNQDAFVAKYSATGDLIWANKPTSPGNEYGSSIAIDALGNVILVGKFSDATDFDPSIAVSSITPFGTGGSKSDAFILKLNSSGDFVFAKRVGSIYFDAAYSVKIDSSENIYIMGQFGASADLDTGTTVLTVSSDGSDTFVIKLNANADFIWGKKIGAVSNFMEVDATGNVYLTGIFSSSFDDFDPSSATFFIPNITNINTFVCKLDTSGGFLWAKNLKGTSPVRTSGIDIGSDGSVYTIGTFKQTVDFDPGTTVFNLTPVSSNENGYISKLDNSGNFVWAGQIGEQSTDCSINDIEIDANNNVILAGGFTVAFDFDPNTTTNYVICTMQTDAYLLKLNQQNLGLVQNQLNNFSVFPNPTSNQINFTYENNLENATLKIITITGQTVVDNLSISGNNFKYDVSSLANGIYIVQVNDGFSVKNSKFIKD